MSAYANENGHTACLLRLSKFKPTREWINKVNLSSFRLKIFFKFVLVWSARENQNILRHSHVYIRSNTPLGQSERAYYLSYFIKEVSRYFPSLYRYIVTSISPTKQTTFRDTTGGVLAKWRRRRERRNSILMTRHYPDLGNASDWSCLVGNLLQPIRSTTQIWVAKRHQYGNSALISQTLFRKERPVASRNVVSFL